MINQNTNTSTAIIFSYIFFILIELWQIHRSLSCGLGKLYKVTNATVKKKSNKLFHEVDISERIILAFLFLSFPFSPLLCFSQYLGLRLGFWLFHGLNQFGLHIWGSQHPECKTGTHIFFYSKNIIAFKHEWVLQKNHNKAMFSWLELWKLMTESEN